MVGQAQQPDIIHGVDGQNGAPVCDVGCFANELTLPMDGNQELISLTCQEYSADRTFDDKKHLRTFVPLLKDHVSGVVALNDWVLHKL